ncbi:tetratricopeptide repeat domain-containing protein [Lophiotrema nucula]|uniref:Tetratricopeptide repeat domain-containing protein n=1 Tax=Lophiotrema nucula TaxID=690887 RepID=A0A6A5ZLB1_9PLEO|nr:tetratricopeptide repeat domain-containing protein [Lophiotrema nucula]
MHRRRDTDTRHAEKHLRNQSSLTGNTSFAPSALNLSNVVSLGPRQDSRVEPNVIAVPGYCTPNVDSWGMRHELEQAALPVDRLSKLHVYTYNASYGASEEFTWQNFLHAGSDLAEELARLVTEFPQRPIILIAHSLGGVLLKKALLLAHQNVQDPRFKLVVDCLSGILFMGTPHASISDEDTLLRHNQVLYGCAKIALQKQASRLPRNDVFQLANLAAAFEQIARIPLLSVFEFTGSRSGVPRLFGKKSKALVDQEFATISTQSERLLGVHLNHSELCKLPMLKNDTYSARDFLRSLFEDVAVNQRWAGPSDASNALEIPASNPLNPLNLAPIEPHRVERPPSIASGKKSHANKSYPQSSLKLPPRLHLISNTGMNTLIDTKKSRLPCFTVPQYPNRDFVGRQDVLETMDKYLLPSGKLGSSNMQGTRLFALCGMGGIGKTDLAVEYAHYRRDKFAAIFWLEAGGVSQLVSDFGRIATHLGLQTDDEAGNLESGIEVAKAWLAKPRDSADGNLDNWLLIFDNADNLDIITDYVPYHGNGSILVTSRDPFAKEHFFNNGSGIDLEPLSTTESATLLRKLVTKPEHAATTDEEDASVELANHLAGLPLAMTQMAGLIRRRHLSIREFVSLYANDARYAEIHDVGNPVQKSRYRYTLATAYDFQGITPNATSLLQLLAFMNPDRVQEYIFFNAQGKAGHFRQHWTASDFESARYELLASSIIKRNIHKKELWIHRVVQAEIRTRIDEHSRYSIFKEAVSLLAKVWLTGDLCSQQVKRWEVCEELLPHIERFYQLHIEYADAWDSFEGSITFPSLLNEAALYLHERGFSHEGKLYLHLALSLCEQANITQEPLISDIHLTMGALCNETNDAQSCLEHNTQCLAIRKAEAEKGNAPDLRLAFAHSQMGIAYMMVRKFALATEYFKQSVEMLKSIEVDPDEFGFPSCNLGLAFWVQGELDDADTTLTDLLAQREALHGKLDKSSYKTGRVLQALGNVRASKATRAETENDSVTAERLWDESFAIHTDCLKQYESTLGRFNHRTADACHKLAEHHIRRKEHTLAQIYLDRALSIWGDRQWYKNESARSSFLRGIHLMSFGDDENFELGTRWIERAKVLRKEILPEEEKRELDTVDFDDLVCFWSI